MTSRLLAILPLLGLLTLAASLVGAGYANERVALAVAQTIAERSYIEARYADIAIENACLKEALAWAESYIPTLTVQVIQQVRVTCYPQPQGTR